MQRGIGRVRPGRGLRPEWGAGLGLAGPRGCWGQPLLPGRRAGHRTDREQLRRATGPWSGVGVRQVRQLPSRRGVVTDAGSPTPGPDLPGRRRVPGREPTHAPGGWPPAGARATRCDASAPPARRPSRSLSCCGCRSSCSGGSLSPSPRGTSAASAPAAPAGQPRGPAPHARAHPAASRPFLAACSGSVWGVGPTVSFTQFYSVPLLPGLPLQAWAGSGGAGVTSCRNIPTVWP